MQKAILNKRTLIAVIATALVSLLIAHTSASVAEARYEQSVLAKLTATKITPIKAAGFRITKISDIPRFISDAAGTLPVVQEKPSRQVAQARPVAVAQPKRAQAPSTTPVKKEQAGSFGHIIVPRMGVNTPILEGATEAVLNSGLWRIPGTGNPARGGNMVIAGHRYMWRPPSNKTFWDIDKMQKDDMIEIKWEGKRYLYKVTDIQIVTPDRVDILNNTTEPQLTLFSCTPRFSTKYRLVVIAKPL